MPWRQPPLSGARDAMGLPIKPTLHAQRWSLAGAMPASGAVMAYCVHLAGGRGTLEHGEGELSLFAGDVVWLPAGQALSLRVDAGSSGVAVGVADTLLAAAAGERADAAPLRDVAARLVVVGAAASAPRDELVRSLHALATEAGGGAPLSRPYLTAHLTVVLVMLWRLASHDAGQASQSPGRGPQRLMRFRHLVEAQFRSHWTVARYAAELAVSPDRLHDQCVQVLGRSPMALVHQRLVREACSLLAGTDLQVERLAADLGFGSSSHFSRFFSRWTGLPPGRWRAQVRAQAEGASAVTPRSYADWP